MASREPGPELLAPSPPKFTGPLRSPVLSTTGQAIVDATTDALATAAVFPIAIVITQLQLRRGKRRTDEKTKPTASAVRNEIFAVAHEVYGEGNGLKDLYSGCAEAAGKAAADSLFRFLVHTAISRQLLKGNSSNTTQTLSPINQLAIRWLVELVTITLTAPIGTVVTRKQVQGIYQKNPKLTANQIISRILSKNGLKGLWAGYVSSLFLTLNLPITLLLNEALNHGLISRAGLPIKSAAVHYVLWGLCHATALSITYPFSILRTRAQAGEVSPTGTLAGDLRHLYESTRAEPLDPVYAGLAAEIARISLKDGASAVLGQVTHASLYQIYCFFSSLFERRRKLDEIISRHSQLSNHAATAAKVDGWGYTNETAELVGDYVEDQAEDWRSFYHWFWDPERRRNGD